MSVLFTLHSLSTHFAHHELNQSDKSILVIKTISKTNQQFIINWFIHYEKVHPGKQSVTKILLVKSCLDRKITDGYEPN